MKTANTCNEVLYVVITHKVKIVSGFDSDLEMSSMILSATFCLIIIISTFKSRIGIIHFDIAHRNFALISRLGSCLVAVIQKAFLELMNHHSFRRWSSQLWSTPCRLLSADREAN